ncbi:hypothetical protein N7457_009432, partial [Penicillium paradoxum]|uniref:uncharacterized protein n=1 Tax=Penicillium paradoxum TaxID=176176 RepID=UPI0025493180
KGLLPRSRYLGSSTYHFSSAGWGFPILAAAAFTRALRVRLTDPGSDSVSCFGTLCDKASTLSPYLREHFSL